MKKILILLVSAVLISIPVAKTIFPSGDFISGLIGLVFLGALTQINRRKKLEWFLIILIGLGIFSLYAFSILWSSNLAAGFKGLETKLSLAVIPLSLGLIGPFNKKEANFLWLSFFTGLVISACYHLVLAACESFYSIDYSAFFYASLSREFHPSYLAMYFSVGLAVVLFSENTWINIKSSTVIKFLLAALFSGFIILLSSRTGFICLGIFLVVHVLKNALQRQFFNISLSAAALLVSGLVYFGSNVAQSRVKGVLELSGVSVKKKDVTYRNSIDSRLIAWKCSTELIASNLGGYGIGDSQDELVNSYKAKGEVFMQTKNFNSHNQFLTTSLSIGVFGFVLLVLLFFILLARAWNQGDWVLGLVTLLLVLNFMTESMLERAEGTTFIPLILCILVFRKD